MFHLILQLAKNGSGTPSQGDSPVPASAPSEGEGSPPEKRFKHLEVMLELKMREGLEKTSQMPAGKDQIEQYFSSVITISEREDPITFWMEKEASSAHMLPIFYVSLPRQCQWSAPSQPWGSLQWQI